MSELLQAPSITLACSDGTDVTLPAAGPHGAVVFFYPKDSTPGCTKEAQEFSAFADEFAALGFTIYGISKDSIKSHLKFIEKHNLTVPLLTDADGLACEGFDIWREKTMYGRKFFGIVRSTFLLDTQGKIIQSWRGVKVTGHVGAVLEAAKSYVAQNA